MLSNYFRLTNQKIQTISRLTCLKWLTSVLLSCKHKINFLKIRRMDQILHDTVVNRRNTVFIKCYMDISLPISGKESSYFMLKKNRYIHNELLNKSMNTSSF